MQILCCYFRYTGRLFLGYVLLVARCNIIRASWETKKEKVQKKVHGGICVSDITFLTAFPSFYVFLLLSSSTSFPIYVCINISLWVVLFRVTISWVNGRDMKLSYNLILHAFFYKQRFFSIQRQCCLAFPWIA